MLRLKQHLRLNVCSYQLLRYAHLNRSHVGY